MGIRKSSGAWAFGFLLATVVALGALPLAAQEPSAARPAGATKPAAAKKARDPSRRVPRFFGQIGLTPEQKEEIYKIRGKHQPEVKALQKQIDEIKAEMMTECESLLNDSQKRLLALRRETATRAKAARAPAPRPSTAPKATEKPAN